MSCPIPPPTICSLPSTHISYWGREGEFSLQTTFVLRQLQQLTLEMSLLTVADVLYRSHIYLMFRFPIDAAHGFFRKSMSPINHAVTYLSNERHKQNPTFRSQCLLRLHTLHFITSYILRASIMMNLFGYFRRIFRRV